MRLILYGTEADKEAFSGALSALPQQCYRSIRVVGYAKYDGFVAALSQNPPDCIVIMASGANGMEGVIAAKSICRSAPVLWFSDDDGFGVQSYRLGCAYFHKKPVSPQVLSAAIARCV